MFEHGQKTPTELAMELGIRRNQLCKWRDQFNRRGKDNAFHGPGRTAAEQQREVEHLRHELARVTEERNILKNGGVLREGTAVKCAFVQSHAKQFTIAAMCCALKISRSGYYGWHTRSDSRRCQRDAERPVILRACTDSTGKSWVQRRPGVCSMAKALNAAGTG